MNNASITHESFDFKDMNCSLHGLNEHCQSSDSLIAVIDGDAQQVVMIECHPVKPNEVSMKNKVQVACDYQGYDFGAHYIDSQCIDGYLWDLDACDGSGNLYEPLETIPCPKCNADAWLENYRWLFISDGANHGSTGLPFSKIGCLYINDEIRARPGAVKKIYRWLKRGYYYGLKNRH
ncbi:hypothetical protein [Providencia rettgeri]|uniref:hypothetical protein n=1 Tax=Providencia rettgeri TaxID=587 RepID=UPI00235FB4AA|nr:hypothetical protein [Providencia rettgeri]